MSGREGEVSEPDDEGDPPVAAMPLSGSPAEIRAAVAKLWRAQPSRNGRIGAAAGPVKLETTFRAEAPAVSASTVEEGEVHAQRLADAVRRAEAVLFAAPAPIDAMTLSKALPPGVEAGDVLVRLRAEYANRGVRIVELADRWCFQTAPDLAFLFEETRTEQRQLSRAAMETLAIIAYCQPATRAEIEEVRGVAVSKGTLDVLMEAGWVKPRGRRRTPGRPVTYGTTDAFLIYFGLDGLDSLPGKEDLRAAGLLSASLPQDFGLPGPVAGEEDALDAESGLVQPVFHADYLGDGGPEE